MSDALPTLQIARRLLALGLSVIPVPRPRPGVLSGKRSDGKVPAIGWRAYQTRLPTDAEVTQWFGSEPMNLAIVTGAVSGVVAVDADGRDALRWCTRRLPYTPWQTRTARGYHLMYRHPGLRVANGVRLETREGELAIDVRGDGGYVIAAGSLHASGVAYREAGDWSEPRASVPVFWPGWLARVPRGPSSGARMPVRTGERQGPSLARARAYLAAIPRPEIGKGSDVAVLSAACRLVRGFDLSSDVAEDLLWAWAGGRSGWTREWVARKVAHAERYGTEPIGGLR